MRLRFVGEDGSIGLKHGQVYDVKVNTAMGYIFVIWKESYYCPYSSLAALTANWEDV